MITADPAIADEHAKEQQHLLGALAAVLAPLAQLSVSKGIRIQVVEEMLRSAMVNAAREAHPTLTSSRIASRISATTGLTRREVTRLVSQFKPRAVQARSPINEVFTHWLSEPALQGPDNKPIALPRHGPAPSFESLANEATRDVHPRTLLEELCRLQLGRHDIETDTVHLLQDAYVPRGDWPRMMGFLGDNVGDHFRAAVANVLGDGKQQLEQAIFADELSADSLVLARELMTRQWRALLMQVSPELERLIEEDRLAGRRQDQCMRIGLFTWSEPMPPAANDESKIEMELSSDQNPQ
jgi:Family of unknown function (DUF6502)